MSRKKFQPEQNQKGSRSYINNPENPRGYHRPARKNQISLNQALDSSKVMNDQIDQKYREGPDMRLESYVQYYEDEPRLEQNRAGRNEIDYRMEREIRQQGRTDDFEECPICSVSSRRPEMVSIGTCSHYFCGDCLFSHILTHIEQFKIITCPLEGCHQKIDQSSPYLKQIPLELQQKYYNILIFQYVSQTSTIKLCPDENCQGYVMVDQNPAICVVCNKEYCPKCMLRTHPGDCEQNQQNFLEQYFQFMKCQKCGLIVEKIVGCDHITCRCGYQFCYRCGSNWLYEHRCQRKVKPLAPRYDPIESVVPQPPTSIAPPARREEERRTRQQNQRQAPQPPPAPAPVPAPVPAPASPARDQRRNAEPQQRITAPQSCIDQSCKRKTGYFLFGLFMLDLFIAMLVLFYCLLAFVVIVIKGMTYSVVAKWFPRMCQANGSDFFLPMIVISIGCELPDLMQHYSLIKQKRGCCPIFAKTCY